MSALAPGAELAWERRVEPDQPQRYAEASGDMNPIHLDEDVAKAAGLPGVILHGLCTLSFAHQALVEWAGGAGLIEDESAPSPRGSSREGGGEPTAVTRLKARFQRPVRPGDVVTVRATVDAVEDGAAEVSFEAVNPDGVVVLGGGEATVRVR